nr:hypothetical protein [Thermoleophilaceae bacterium]
MSATVPLPPFSNEPLLELRRAPVRESLVAALGELEPRLPLTVPILVGEDALAADDFRSTDPGEPERVVATVARAGAR